MCKMRSGFKVGTIFGINIHIDWSWILIFLLVTWNLAGAVFPSLHPDWGIELNIALGIAASLLFFVSILLHELHIPWLPKRVVCPCAESRYSFLEVFPTSNESLLRRRRNF